MYTFVNNNNASIIIIDTCSIVTDTEDRVETIHAHCRASLKKDGSLGQVRLYTRLTCIRTEKPVSVNRKKLRVITFLVNKCHTSCTRASVDTCI